MRLRPLLLTGTLIAVALIALADIDWGFNALRLYMASRQPLEVGESPYRESSSGVDFVATAITDELKMPWSFAFMPNEKVSTMSSSTA